MASWWRWTNDPSPKSSFMGFSYQRSDVHQRYDLGRTLTSSAITTLMEMLRGYVAGPVDLLIDLGCGTGRFTEALSQAFDAVVVGVEPAANMIEIAAAKPHPRSVGFVQGRADHIPLGNGEVDLVFMSQVFHHLTNRPLALREIHRTLKSVGSLCIRQTTRENLDSYFYQRFFPDARMVDEKRLPSRAELLGLTTSLRYRLIALETLHHEIAPTNVDYVDKIALRAYSDLECIADRRFHEGLHALRNYCIAHPDHPKSAENDLFIFARS